MAGPKCLRSTLMVVVTTKGHKQMWCLPPVKVSLQVISGSQWQTHFSGLLLYTFSKGQSLTMPWEQNTAQLPLLHCWVTTHLCHFQGGKCKVYNARTLFKAQSSGVNFALSKLNQADMMRVHDSWPPLMLSRTTNCLLITGKMWEQWVAITSSTKHLALV